MDEKKTKKKAGKRLNGEGTIMQRQDGRWMSAASINGQRVYFYGKDPQEAKGKRDEALEQSRKGIYIKPTKETFEQWLDEWLEKFVKPSVRPTTFDSYYRWIRNHVKPGLGSIKLKELRPEQIQDFYNKTLNQKKQVGEGNISPRSVKYLHILIKKSLKKAFQLRKISWNPADAVDPPQVKKKKVGYFNEEEIIRFRTAIEDDYWYPAFLMALGCGMRVGEVAALKWGAINFKDQTVTVLEAVSRVDTYQKEGPKTRLDFHGPKSDKGFRAIPLPTPVIKALERFRDKQREYNGGVISLQEDQEFIFRWPDTGKLAETGYLSKHFLKLARENGFNNITFHGMRHSFATALLKAGEHPKVVQELLGDATISVVLDTYSHVVPGLKEQASKTMSNILEQKPQIKRK
jgi:integrase